MKYTHVYYPPWRELSIYYNGRIPNDQNRGLVIPWSLSWLSSRTNDAWTYRIRMTHQKSGSIGSISQNKIITHPNELLHNELLHRNWSKVICQCMSIDVSTTLIVNSNFSTREFRLPACFIPTRREDWVQTWWNMRGHRGPGAGLWNAARTKIGWTTLSE